MKKSNFKIAIRNAILKEQQKIAILKLQSKGKVFKNK